MGQNRTDTANQLYAKERVAERRRCPKCQRKAALSTKFERADDGYRVNGWFRTCRWCGHEVGMRDGDYYGREQP